MFIVKLLACGSDWLDEPALVLECFEEDIDDVAHADFLVAELFLVDQGIFIILVFSVPLPCTGIKYSIMTLAWSFLATAASIIILACSNLDAFGYLQMCVIHLNVPGCVQMHSDSF